MRFLRRKEDGGGGGREEEKQKYERGVKEQGERRGRETFRRTKDGRRRKIETEKGGEEQGGKETVGVHGRRGRIKQGNELKRRRP